MEKIELTRDCEYLNSRYRITYYEFGNIVEVTELVRLKWYQKIFRTDGQEKVWKRVYFGHISPLQKAVETYEIGRKAANLLPKLKIQP